MIEISFSLCLKIKSNIMYSKSNFKLKSELIIGFGISKIR